MNFSIEFLPGLPHGAFRGELPSIENLDAGVILTKYPQLHDVIYHVADKIFAYYPASILTVLNDMHQEWELVRDRIPHPMTLSGYTVLELAFEGDTAIFCDPLEETSSGIKKSIGVPILAEDVEQTFRVATEDLLKLLGSVSQR